MGLCFCVFVYPADAVVLSRLQVSDAIDNIMKPIGLGMLLVAAMA